MIGRLNIQALRGDTFKEYPFEILIDSVALDLTGSVIKIDLKKDACSLAVLTITSVASAGITITNAVNGEFKINTQIIDIQAGNYVYDIEFNINGVIETLIKGDFIITNDVTR